MIRRAGAPQPAPDRTGSGGKSSPVCSQFTVLQGNNCLAERCSTCPPKDGMDQSLWSARFPGSSSSSWSDLRFSEDDGLPAGDRMISTQMAGRPNGAPAVDGLDALIWQLSATRPTSMNRMACCHFLLSARAHETAGPPVHWVLTAVLAPNAPHGDPFRSWLRPPGRFGWSIRICHSLPTL